MDALTDAHRVRISIGVFVVDEFSEGFGYSASFLSVPSCKCGVFDDIKAEVRIEGGMAKVRLEWSKADDFFEFNVYDYVLYDRYAKVPFEYRIKCTAIGTIGRVEVQVKCAACAAKSAYDIRNDGNILSYDWWRNKKVERRYETLEKLNNVYMSLQFIPDCTALDAMDDGWRSAFGLRMCREIRRELLKRPCWLFKYQILQIKEKNGYLHWYDGGHPKCMKIFDIIRKYERISMQTCISCGKPAKWMTTGWILPYCDECIEHKNYFGKTIRETGVKPNPYYKKEENDKNDEEHEQVTD